MTFNFETSDFTKVVYSPAFVDKTSFINELFEPMFVRNESLLITAPPKFGKSTVLSMVKRFFELETNDRGEPKTGSAYLVEPIRDTANYRLFVDNDLNVIRDTAIMDGYFGSFPVIYVDFRVHDDVDNDDNNRRYENNISTVADVSHIFRNAVRACYRQYGYLRNSSKLSAEEKRDFEAWWLAAADNLTEANVTRGLRSLTEYVGKHFQREVVLLIDHYDSYAENLNFKLAPERVPTKKNEQRLNEMMQRQTSLLSSALRDNYEYLLLAIISGRLNILDLDFVQHYQFGAAEPHRFTDYYGWTESEASSVLRRWPTIRRNPERCKVRLRSAYGGYRAAENDNRTFYNPWSVGRFLSEKKIAHYWPSSSTAVAAVRNLTRALTATSVKIELEMLIQGKCLYIVYYRKLDAFDLVSMANLMTTPELDLFYTEYYWSFLLQRGYLTTTDVPPEVLTELTGVVGATSTQSLGYNLTGVRIPNEEVRSEFLRLLDRYYIGGEVCNFDERLIKMCRVFIDKKLFSIYHRSQQVFEKPLKKFQRILKRLFDSGFMEDALGNRCIKMNQEGVHSLLFYIMYHTNVGCITETTNQNYRMDLFTAKGNRGLVLNVKYNDTSQQALDEIVRGQFYRLFEKDERLVKRNVTSKIFIGLNMDEHRNPTFSYLIDSTDLEQAKHVQI